ncbi:MAG TPA: hypothetical protein VGK79_14105 [Gaiellaceae bacterium]
MLDVAALCVVERQLFEQAADLCRVVVLDRCLEPFADRRRLPQLPAEPAEE